MRNKIISMMVVLLALFTISGCSSEKPITTQDSTDQHYQVVIVGAGIAGLTGAHFLKDQNIKVLEKNDVVGGRTISGFYKSFTYAKGTEYLGKPESSLAKMIRELKLDPKEIPSPMDGYFDGENFYYGSDGIKRYLVNHSSGEQFKKFVTLLEDEYGQYDEIPDLDYDENAKYMDNISAANWLLENDIDQVFIDKYNVAAKGLFGANMQEISALSFIPEAEFDYEGETAADFNVEDYQDYTQADINQEYVDAKLEASDSYSFEKGLTELTDAIAAELGDKIQLNSTVKKVEAYNDGYKITYVDANMQEYSITADQIILAVPSTEALAIASDVLTKQQISLMNEIEYSSYATVALYSETPIFDKAFDLAVPDDYYFTDVYDATWIQRYYDQSLANDQNYIISIYVAPDSYTNHDLDNITDQQLLDNIYQDLNKIFKDASSKVTGYDIQRFTHAYPVMTLGAYDRLMQLNDLNDGSLILAGDYMIYPTFEAAVQSGALAAEKIIDNQ